MAERVNIAGELVASLEEGLAILRGEKAASRVHLPPDWPDVQAIRARTGLPHEAFAARFGLKVAAVRDWEQGLRRPDPAAHSLLRVTEKKPEVMERAVRAAQEGGRCPAQPTAGNAVVPRGPSPSGAVARPGPLPPGSLLDNV